MVEATKTPEMTKRAKWEKLKKELLKLPKKIPEILAIAIDTKNDAITIVTKPVSISMELSLYRIGRNLRYVYGFPFDRFEIDNVANLAPGFSWKVFIQPGFKIIYENE